MGQIDKNYQSEVMQLVYISTYSGSHIFKDLNLIEHVSLINNRRKQITGLLVYGNEKFMQFLEGDESDILSLMSSIESDSRHKQLDIICQRRLSGRQFAKWFMRITFPGEIHSGSGPIHHKLFSGNHSSSNFMHEAERSFSILHDFKQHCYDATG